MGGFVVVSFVQPLPAGFVFARGSWPLHITLVRFDTEETAAGTAARIGSGLASGLGITVMIGGGARFGRNGSVPVCLVEPHPGLLALHTGVLDALDGTGAHVYGLQHTRADYRPHVSHGAGRLLPGDQVRIRQAALVDMRPGGDSRLRTLLAVWGDPGTDPGPGAGTGLSPGE